MTVFCGIDWAEGHHDIALVDDSGQLLAKRRIGDNLTGYKLLLDLLAEHGDSPSAPIPVAIETSHGLLVAALRTGSRQVFPINPLAAARYRDRHGVSRKKSDPGDALVLANILRTDMPMHRPLPAGSDQAKAITVLARAQQDAVWNRQQIGNQVRSLLREFYPAALLAFQGRPGGLARPDARAVLALAPTPHKAAHLSLAQLRSTLKRAGRKRGIDAEAERLRDIFRAEYAHQPPAVEDAFGQQLLALLKQLDAASQASDDLAEAVEATFRDHPDAEILLSFPCQLACSAPPSWAASTSPTPSAADTALPWPSPQASSSRLRQQLRRLKLSGGLQLALVALLALLMVEGIAIALPDGHTANLTPFTPHGWFAVGDAATLLFFSFSGWEAASYLSGEFRDPRRCDFAR